MTNPAQPPSQLGAVIGGIFTVLVVALFVLKCGRSTPVPTAPARSAPTPPTMAECEAKAQAVIRLCSAQGEPACTRHTDDLLSGPCRIYKK